jgi:hypothetical protein
MSTFFDPKLRVVVVSNTIYRGRDKAAHYYTATTPELQ